MPDPLPTPPAAPLSYLGRITEQIDSAASLDHKEQSALVSELRRGARDPETAADARKLLERMRKRDDLLARIGDEIDELLEEAREVKRPEPERPEARSEPPRAEPLSLKADTRRRCALGRPPRPTRVATRAEQAARSSRLAGAMYGGGIGFGIGVLAAMMGGMGNGLARVPAIGGAIAGAIAKGRPLVVRYAVIGAFVLGFGVLLFGAMNDMRRPSQSPR